MSRLSLLKEVLQDEEGKKVAKSDKDRQGNYVSHVAAALDNLEILQLLVENGVNIFDLKNNQGETPL